MLINDKDSNIQQVGNLHIRKGNIELIATKIMHNAVSYHLEKNTIKNKQLVMIIDDYGKNFDMGNIYSEFLKILIIKTKEVKNISWLVTCPF